MTRNTAGWQSREADLARRCRRARTRNVFRPQRPAHCVLSGPQPQRALCPRDLRGMRSRRLLSLHRSSRAAAVVAGSAGTPSYEGVGAGLWLAGCVTCRPFSVSNKDQARGSIHEYLGSPTFVTAHGAVSFMPTLVLSCSRSRFRVPPNPSANKPLPEAQASCG